MKILILTNNDVGLYNFRKELIEKLIELKNEVYISLPNGERVKDLVKIGCEFIDTQVDRRGMSVVKDMKLLFSYFKILKHTKPDVVLTFTIKPNIYGGIIAKLLRVKAIHTVTRIRECIHKRLMDKKYHYIIK